MYPTNIPRPENNSREPAKTKFKPKQTRTREKSKIFAKGIVRQDSESVKSSAGLKTSQLPEGISHEVIHTDDLVILPYVTLDF